MNIYSAYTYDPKRREVRVVICAKNQKEARSLMRIYGFEYGPVIVLFEGCAEIEKGLNPNQEKGIWYRDFWNSSNYIKCSGK